MWRGVLHWGIEYLSIGGGIPWDMEYSAWRVGVTLGYGIFSMVGRGVPWDMEYSVSVDTSKGCLLEILCLHVSSKS